MNRLMRCAAPAAATPGACTSSSFQAAHVTSADSRQHTRSCIALKPSHPYAGGGKNDLKLSSKAGLDRAQPSASEGYTFADFADFGWSRTLPNDWMTVVPT